jgi:lysophospholipase L1-like esterase
MHRNWLRLLCGFAGVIALAAASPAPAADQFFFKDGDSVAIIGDSITEQRLYTEYIETWTVTRFPKWKITFRNVGIGGDTSPGGDKRFERDVVSFKPTAMTVDFGMNDGGYGAFNEARYNAYMKGLQSMADKAKAAHIRVAWITPQPIEPGEDGPAKNVYNTTLERFSAGVKEIADKNRGLFVDQFHPFLDVLDKARAADAKNHIGGGDAVHPGPPGQALMAYNILKGLQFPDFVSGAEIDAETKQGSGKNCKVTEVAATEDGGIKFTREDEAIPFFPEQAESIQKWTPIREDLNQYMLTVKGIKPGKYEVRLGGKKVADFTAENLAKGVNLAEAALSAGPVADQAKAVQAAVEAKNRYYHDRIFRGVVLSAPQIPDWLDIKLSPQDIETKRQAAIEDRIKKRPELNDSIVKALVIKPHTVEIVPAK